MQQIIITLTSADGTVARKALAKPEGKPVRLQVPEGVKVDVQVQGHAQGKSAEQPNVKHDLQLKQVGQDLVIEGEGEKLVEVTDFYATPSASVGSVGWDYAEPVATDVAVTSVEGKSAGQGVQAMASADAESFFAGYGMPVVLGGAAVGVAALTAGSTAVASTVVTGVFTAGPAVKGNDLSVQLYKTDGHTQLGGPVSLNANGKFSVDIGSYTGAVLVQLRSKGTGADYRDEATGLDVDLAIDLLSMGTVGAGSNTLNINSLTTMAAKLAGVTSSGGQLSGTYDATKAATANKDIAKAFGLSDDVTKLDSTPVIDASGNANVNASDLGKVLAALSGLDAKNGGLQATIDAYVPTAGTSISSTALNNIKTDLMEGAAATQAKLVGITDLVKAVATVLAAGSSTVGYSMDAIATNDVIESTEAALFTSTSTLTFKVPTGKTPTDLEVWLPGASVKGTGTISIANGVATYTLGAGEAATLNALSDGVARFQVKASGSSASTAALTERLVMVDKVDDAPTKVTLINTVASLAELADAATTTADIKVADIVVADRDDGSANTLRLTGPDAALFKIDGNSLYLKASTALNFEVKSSYQVAVTATGGTPSATVTSTLQTLTLTEINEAPTAVGTIAAQTAVKNQNAWSLNLASYFTDVDANDALTYTLTSGTLPTGLTLTNGVIGGTPTGEATAASYTITATDKGGLKTTQTFSLGVVAAPVVQSFTVLDATGVPTKGKGGESATFEVTFSEGINFSSAFSATFTVGTQTVTATSTQASDNSTNGLNKVTFTANVPSTGDGTFTLTAFSGGGTVTGKVSGQPMVNYAGSLAYSSYTVDNTAPAITSSSFNVDENATSFTSSGALAATDTNGPVTWTMGTGGDEALFNLTNGVLSLKAAKNYEADVTSTHKYTVNVVATDAVGNTSNQAVTVNLQDVNEAPTAVGTIGAQHAVSGQAFNFDAHGFFADVDAGTNGTLHYTISGAPSGFSIDASTGVITGTHTGVLAAQQVTVTATDGGNLHVDQTFNMDVLVAPVISSKLDNVTNFDVRSDIVLTASENVTAVTGKKIHLVNDGGTGYDSENTVHSYDIDVTDTSQVTIAGNKITLNPTWDLDLANNYHIEIDAGAFKDASSGMDSVAISDATTLNFSTVTPFVWTDIAGQQDISKAVASQKMVSGTDGMVTSGSWFSLMGSLNGNAQGVGDTSGSIGATYDLSTKDYVILVGKDTSTTPTLTDLTHSESGISIPYTTWVALQNFGLNDSIYVDDQFNNQQYTNDIEGDPAAVSKDVPVAGSTEIAMPASNGQVWLDITLASEVVNVIANATHSTTFQTLAELKAWTNSQAVMVS